MANLPSNTESSTDDSNFLASGGALNQHQFKTVVTRWRERRTTMQQLTERLSLLRAEQRVDDAKIRGFMERNDRQEIPTVVRGPDGQPRQTGTIWLSNPRPVPKPLTKGHLGELIDTYDRIDEVTREHLKNYIWSQREFGPETVSVNFDAYCEDGSTVPKKRKQNVAAP